MGRGDIPATCSAGTPSPPGFSAVHSGEPPAVPSAAASPTWPVTGPLDQPQGTPLSHVARAASVAVSFNVPSRDPRHLAPVTSGPLGARMLEANNEIIFVSPHPDRADANAPRQPDPPISDASCRVVFFFPGFLIESRGLRLVSFNLQHLISDTALPRPACLGGMNYAGWSLRGLRDVKKTKLIRQNEKKKQEKVKQGPCTSVPFPGT